MEINFPNLTSINNGVSLAYNSQLWATDTVYGKFCYEATSSGRDEVYPRINMLPGLREWVGDRVVHSLSTATFTISNKLFEETIAINRTDIEDDRYGLLTPAAQMLGENAARLPDLLMATLMGAGETTTWYDGQYFFDTDHPDYTSAGAATTAANYVSGSNAAWYLLDVSRVLKPFIFQRRRPFQVVPKFSMTDPQVFWNKEFEWGVDGRCAAGYGLWQLAYKSKAALTVENLLAARTAMASYRRPDGSPLGIRGTLLVVPSSLYARAKALAEDEQIPNTFSNDYVSGTVTLYPNTARGMFTALENPWLN